MKSDALTDKFNSRFLNVGLKAKLLIAISPVIILLGFLTALFVYIELTNTLNHQLEHHNLIITKNLSANATDLILTQNILKLQNLIDDMQKNEEDIAYIYIISSKGKVLAHTFQDGFPAGLKGINTPAPGQACSSKLLDTENGYIREFAVRLFKDLGTAHVGISESRIRKTISQALWAIIFITLLFLGIGIFAINIIASNVLKPVKMLSIGAKAIESGNYGYRVDVKANDETGALAAAFNNMASELQASIANLKQEIMVRLKSEFALRQSEEKYRSLVDCTSDSIYLVDADHKYLFINKQHLLRLGLSEEQYTNKAYSDFHSPEETELFIQKADSVFKSGESLQYEYKSFRDGKCFIQTISPVRDFNNKTTSVTVISKDITMLKQAEEKLYSMSITDELTGLYNRRGFLALSEQQLKLANREDKKMFLMSADLDFLKIINDTVGHQRGDMAIINTANILKDTFRESDIVARIGGDEFVVLGVDTPDTNIEILAERLRENLNTHNHKANEPLGELSLSYGFTIYDPKQPRSIDELLSEADGLMYQHKRRTR
ncbi:MAG: diguanylate cyclase [Nitrospirae bacterium]|nr:diguanylate cyclase [Nitrospirota bacterium]